ncbi:MAG: polyprenol monophosphomannose synthase [Limisphaerales bacterium]
MHPRTLVISPTYNEKENLPDLMARVLDLPDFIELLVVDDRSPDGTGELADAYSAKHPARVHVLHRTTKDGLGRAYIAGFQWALERGYERILEMDADLSHNPADIPRFLEASENADLVLGSRYRDGIRVINWPLNRLMLSLGAALYVRMITGMPFSDPTGGYKCFRREALQRLGLESVKSNGYSFQIELTHRIWRQGLRVAEVPIVFTDRFHGKSKMSWNIVREALLVVWHLAAQHGFRRRPVPGPGSGPNPGPEPDRRPAPPAPQPPSDRDPGSPPPSHLPPL